MQQQMEDAKKKKISLNKSDYREFVELSHFNIPFPPPHPGNL